MNDNYQLKIMLNSAENVSFSNHHNIVNINAFSVGLLSLNKETGKMNQRIVLCFEIKKRCLFVLHQYIQRVRKKMTSEYIHLSSTNSTKCFFGAILLLLLWSHENIRISNIDKKDYSSTCCALGKTYAFYTISLQFFFKKFKLKN